MARISYKAEYEALKAEYEGMPGKSQIAEFRKAYSEDTVNQAKQTGMSEEAAQTCGTWARLAVDSLATVLGDIKDKDFVGFSAISEVVAQRSHRAYRGTYGRDADYTKRRQNLADKIAYLGDEEMLAKIEAMIAEKEAKEAAQGKSAFND